MVRSFSCSMNSHDQTIYINKYHYIVLSDHDFILVNTIEHDIVYFQSILRLNNGIPIDTSY